MDFQDGGCDDQLGFSIDPFLAIMCLLGALMLLIKFHINWILVFRGEAQIINSQLFVSIYIYRSRTNAWGKQNQPCHKKVKRQRGPIILAILVDLLSTTIWAKIMLQGVFGSREEGF